MDQTISTQIFKSDAVQVPTVGLKAGTYLLSLTADGQEPVAHRFIVQ